MIRKIKELETRIAELESKNTNSSWLRKSIKALLIVFGLLLINYVDVETFNNVLMHMQTKLDTLTTSINQGIDYNLINKEVQSITLLEPVPKLHPINLHKIFSKVSDQEFKLFASAMIALGLFIGRK